MYTRITTLPQSMSPVLPSYMDPDQVLFFDIETSGFSADVTTLYLIGFIYRIDGSWSLEQWFADDNQSEVQILHSFLELSERFSHIIHYNGTGFDLPYLAKRCQRYQIPFYISEDKSFDLYKKLYPYRHLLPVANLKQKSLEQYLNIIREDRYDGGQLVRIYAQYIKSKYGHLPEEAQLMETLLLHNEEDLTGLMQIMRLLSIPALISESQVESAILEEENKSISYLKFSLSLSLEIPEKLEFQHKTGIHFYAEFSQATLIIPLLCGELKYFYTNYKDYYYLPMEDMAIHKSVATYVEKEYRIKAKAATCYIKRQGRFVPQFQPDLQPFYKLDYQDTLTWVEVKDDFLQDKLRLTQYARKILSELLIK